MLYFLTAVFKLFKTWREIVTVSGTVMSKEEIEPVHVLLIKLERLFFNLSSLTDLLRLILIRAMIRAIMIAMAAVKTGGEGRKVLDQLASAAPVA